MSSFSVDTDSAMVMDGEPSETSGNADVVVTGRNVEVPDHFRQHVTDKLSRLERFDRTIYLFDVELYHEKNRRQRKNCQHIEITVGVHVDWMTVGRSPRLIVDGVFFPASRWRFVEVLVPDDLAAVVLDVRREIAFAGGCSK